MAQYTMMAPGTLGATCGPGWGEVPDLSALGSQMYDPAARGRRPCKTFGHTRIGTGWRRRERRAGFVTGHLTEASEIGDIVAFLCARRVINIIGQEIDAFTTF